MISRLKVGIGNLYAIPSVHYRSAFAERVNQFCRDESTRPDAIAVELGQGAVDALVSWLRQLEVDRGRPLPCMLGLVRGNHRIHPAFRHEAIKLQGQWGRPLHKIPAHILRDRLEFSSGTLLCLSATDSIFEAVRCGVELDIPIIGVDLEEFAHRKRKELLLEDPVVAQRDLEGYIRRNEIRAANARDDDIDVRREKAMASRLKHLGAIHRSVLFVCGLAHWTNLKRLLQDEEISEAVSLAKGVPEQYIRVLVDPSLAIHQMDIFPDLTPDFEARRTLPLGNPGRIIIQVDFMKNKLAVAMEKAGPQDGANLLGYTQYLMNLCISNLRQIPDLSTMLTAAQSMIGLEFANRLADALVSKAVDWANPDSWPDLPYLRAEPLDDEEFSLIRGTQRVKIMVPGGHSDPFFINGTSEQNTGSSRIKIPQQFEDPEPKEGSGGDGNIQAWVWPPHETLFSVMAYQAAEMAHRNASGQVSDPFEGSLQDGFDMKSTLRSFARGEDRIYVRSDRESKLDSVEEAQGEPVVFIFSDEDVVYSCDWDARLAGKPRDIRRFVEDKDRYDLVTNGSEDYFVPHVLYRQTVSPAHHAKKSVVEMVVKIWGSINFGNPCIHFQQAARWLEENNYECCPKVSAQGFRALERAFQQEHRLNVHAGTWKDTLIRFGLPYAKERVVIVAPDGYLPSSLIREEARSSKVILDVLPANYFSAERLDLVRNQALVCPSNTGATKWPKEAEIELGPVNMYRNLLPEKVLAQIESPVKPVSK